MNFLLPLFIILFIVSLILNIIFAVKQNTEKLKKHEFLLLKKQLEMMELSHEKTKAVHHDLNRHAGIIAYLLELGRFDDAKQYISEINEELKSIRLPSVSGCHVIDAVLNEKYLLASDKNIDMSFDIDRLNKINVSSVDMCSILSNAIDNAIEACEKIDNPSDRFISVTLGIKDSMFIVSIKNTISEKTYNESVNLLSKKPDAENHGIGLKNINRILKKYKGTLSTRCDNEYFYFSAAVPVII